MRLWIRRMADWAKTRRGGRTRPSRRRESRSFGAEALETREVLSATGGVPFATTTGQVTVPGRPAVVVFEVQPGRVVSDRSVPTLLGLDARALPGSAVEPKVVSIRSLSHRPTSGVATRQGPFLTHVAIPLRQPSLYAVSVTGRGTVGPFALDAFLPGDVNGDGAVDRTDLARVRFGYGSHVGSPRYTPAADFDGSGHIDHFDLTLTRHNLGSRASIIALATGMPSTARAAR